MPKFLYLIFSTFSFLSASEQLIVVIAEDMNRSEGLLQRYTKEILWQKNGSSIPVILGRNGLGYAQGGEPLKQEGDGRTPAGVFSISSTFGYSEIPNSAMPYLYADENLICVDDPEDSRYNRIVQHRGGEFPKSYERMRRDDEVYRNGAVINYNGAGEKGRGSCIFIHLNHSDNHPTSGCTAMEEAALKEVIGWLDPQKKPIILQIPKSDCTEYQKEFQGITCE